MVDVAIAWTGGKDSSLALYKAQRMGYRAKCLVTFAWSKDTFLAHPLEFITLQAQALDMTHKVLPVSEPFERGYEEVLSLLKHERGINGLVTGDIDEVAIGHSPNWLGQRAANCNIDLIRPLWQKNRIELLREFLGLGFRAVFSCVDNRWFTDDWLGAELSNATISQLIQIHERTGMDLCGEQGEYHTMTTDGPCFRKRIQIESYTKQGHDPVRHLMLNNVRLVSKPAI